MLGPNSYILGNRRTEDIPEVPKVEEEKVDDEEKKDEEKPVEKTGRL